MSPNTIDSSKEEPTLVFVVAHRDFSFESTMINLCLHASYGWIHWYTKLRRAGCYVHITMA